MPLSGLKILLAEDNPTNQMVAVQMLESLGADVTLAVDGAEALEILQLQIFDVALIDIEMPRIFGIDLIRRVRTMDGPLSRMPMIALTAYVMREHRIAIDEAGADGIIAKPILSIEKFGDDILEHVQDSTGAQLHPTEIGHARPDDQPALMNIETFETLRASFAPETFVELTEKIRSDVSSAQKRIDQAYQNGDLEELRGATHILISVAGVIGAAGLQTLAQCLNSAGHRADSSVIEKDGPELVAEASRVLTFVRNSVAE